MHKLAEKIADCLKAKIEGIGIDNISGQDLVELGMWTDIVKDMICYDKDKRIVEAMDEAEDSEEAMRYIEMYEDYPRKGYRGQPRDSKGRYMSRKGRRMGYEPIYDMMPDMDWEDAEYHRDMDRPLGKMYYTEPMTMEHTDKRYGKSGMARKGYMDSKEMHKDSSPESKQAKMKELENYLKTMAEDLTEAIEGSTPEERTMVKNKLSVLLQKM